MNNDTNDAYRPEGDYVKNNYRRCSGLLSFDRNSVFERALIREARINTDGLKRKRFRPRKSDCLLFAQRFSFCSASRILEREHSFENSRLLQKRFN